MNIKQSLSVFGLTDAATEKELQQAYRKGVRLWHPDRFQQDTEQRRQQAETRMRELNLAFEKLSEHHKKHGHFKEVFEPAQFKAPPPARPTYYKQAAPEPEPVEEEIIVPEEKSGRSRIWFGFAFSLLAGYFMVSGLIFDETPSGLVDTASISDNSSQMKTGSETATELASVQEIPVKETPEEVTPAKVFEQLKKPEPKKEEKSAFETRSVFVKEKPEDPDEPYFTYGSTIGKVYEVQGIPTRTEGDVWFYGDSEVRFKNGRVVAWENTGNPMLKVRY